MTHIKVIVTKVAGVTFENRQQIIAGLYGDEPCRIEPEPDNQYDPNALKILVAKDGVVHHVGYVPRELAAEIAPHLDGEAVMATLRGVTGGFNLFTGGTAARGLRIEFQYPSDDGDL